MAHILINLFIVSFCVYCKEATEPVDPECFVPGKQEKRCCSDYRTIDAKCYACIGSFGMECIKPCPSGYHGIQCSEKCLCDECNKTTGACPNLTITTEIESLRKEKCYNQVIIIILCGCIVSLLVLLVAVVVKRKTTSYGHYQHGLVNIDTTSAGYSTTENQTYLECDPTKMIEIKYLDNQMEEIRNSESRSEHYVSVTSKFNPKEDVKVSSRLDVWKTIKDDAKKIKEKNVMRILSKRFSMHNDNDKCRYMSVVDDHSPSCKTQNI